jgi:uncharacterized membrane protein (UPF0127 family)
MRRPYLTPSSGSRVSANRIFTASGGARRGAGVRRDVNARLQPFRFRGLQRAELAGRSVPVAATALSRLLGLALLRASRAGEGLLIPRCRSVHTFGMRFPLHLIFLDDRRAPISVRGSAPPNRVFRDPRADSVLELPARRPEGLG